jgi:hypothetical protein
MANQDDTIGKGSKQLIVLRPYQQEISSKIKKASHSKGKLLISLAPGFGRSVTIISTLDELLKKNKIQRALILTPRSVLTEQYLCLFQEFSNLQNIVAKIDSSKSSLVNSSEPKVVILTLAMFKKVVSLLPTFDIVIVDECQSLSDTDWSLVSSMHSAIVGFTTLHPSQIKDSLLSSLNKQTPDYSYGMASIRLGQLAEIIPGAAYHKAELQNNGKWKFIRIRDVKTGGMLEATTYISDEAANQKKRYSLKLGDILLPNIFDFDRKSFITEKDLPAIASNNFFIIRSKSIPPKLLFEYLQNKVIAEAFHKELEIRSVGTAIKRIRLADACEIPVPLPFSREHLIQLANVRQLEDIGELEKTLDIINRLKQAYLAFSEDK